MKSVKLVSVTFVLALLCCAAHSQVGRRLNEAAGRAAERAATNQTERRTEDAVNKGIDAIFDGNQNQNQQQGQQQQQSQQQQQAPPPAETPVAAPVQTDNNPSLPAGGQTPQQGGMTAAEMAYARNDFVPGDEIIFEDDVTREKMGEFPSQWDLLMGSAEVANIGGLQCIYLEPSTHIAPLMKNMKNFLPDVYTIELDFWQNDGHVTGEPPWQNYQLLLYDERGSYDDVQSEVIGIVFGEGRVGCWYKTPSGDVRESNVDNIPGNLNAWNRFSFSFNQRALKVYINGVRIINIPNAAGAKYFTIHKNQYENHKGAVSNIRVAKGAVPLYDRMMSDGKFITYGITFDVGKSTIKPESMGEINRIVTLMKEKPELKFSVEGHTDSTGSAANNQTLSEARSQAVVDKLVGLGIARDRLKAAGKGQTSPIADNGTDEGRAKNRRMEFVKI